jgi:peptidoglycan/xylan/chitin deacetylase (PgdA/CDA1 family)
MKKLILRCLYVLQIHHLARYFIRRKIPVLCYHGFTSRPKGGHPGIENHQGKHLNIKIFKSQMEYVKKHYRVISAEEMLAFYERKDPLPDYSLVITVDDGYESNYTLAFPLLKEKNLPAAIFVTTDFVNEREWLWVDRLEYALNRTTSPRLELKVGGEPFSLDFSNIGKKSAETEIRAKIKTISQDSKREVLETLEHELGERLSSGKDIPEIYRPLSWLQIRDMIESGLISFGSHSASHPVLSRLSDEGLREEVLKSKKTLEEKAGVPCLFFCYPNGREGDFNANTKQALQEAGYAAAFTTVEGMNDERSDVFELKRYGVSEDLLEFIMTVSGVVTFLSRIKQAIRRFCGKSRA